jgi:heme exporter protein CcmB
VNVSLAIFWKDLLIEWRSRDRVVAMLLFSLLVVVVFHFALPGGASVQTRANAPGLLWVAYVFAALFGLGRAFSLELENDAFSGLALAPADRGWVFLGKAAANLVILGVVQVVTALAFALVSAAAPAADPAALGRRAGHVAAARHGHAALGARPAASRDRRDLSDNLLPGVRLRPRRVIR